MNKCCRIAFLTAVLLFEKEPEKKPFTISTALASEARLILRLLKESFSLVVHWKVEKSRRFKKDTLYKITIEENKDFTQLLREVGIRSRVSGIKEEIVWKSCCKRSFIGGAFLSVGSLNSPHKSYHMEWAVKEKALAMNMQKVIRSMGLSPALTFRRNHYCLYLKKADDIVKILNLMGAYHAQLRFEEVRALKETKNEIHRMVNCETANLDKVAKAGARQVLLIRLLKKNSQLEGLPIGLKEIAKIRLKFPDISFKELGMKFKPELSKSSVSHRLARIEEIAEEIKKQNKE
ncbi:MAG: DNA-binding protein WhiA [Firmicutes bacterium]|nr:DNA-binding protein WhiA [Bacillota bacterium]